MKERKQALRSIVTRAVDKRILSLALVSARIRVILSFYGKREIRLVEYPIQKQNFLAIFENNSMVNQ